MVQRAYIDAMEAKHITAASVFVAASVALFFAGTHIAEQQQAARDESIPCVIYRAQLQSARLAAQTYGAESQTAGDLYDKALEQQQKHRCS